MLFYDCMSYRILKNFILLQIIVADYNISDYTPATGFGYIMFIYTKTC